MYKRYLVLPLALFLLAAFYSTARAVPNKDSDIVIWPPFWQWESPWNDDYYAGKPNKPFVDNGCLVTSLAMLFRYHGLINIPDEEHHPKLNPMCNTSEYKPLCTIFWDLYLRTNPGTLNEWFTENNVYIQDGAQDLLDPLEAVKKFYVRYPGYTGYNGLTATVKPNDSCQPAGIGADCADKKWSDPMAQKLLDHDLDEGRPDIMKIKWLPKGAEDWHEHYVLIGGYDEENTSYRAYDPNQRYDYSYIPPPGLNWLYKNRGLQYKEDRIIRYKHDYLRYPYHPIQSSLVFTGFSPIEMQVIDPMRRITGQDPATGEEAANIPHAYYTEESEPSVGPNEILREPAKILFINEPAAGNYVLRITGTGSGPYSIMFRGTKEDGTSNLHTTITGTAYPGSSEIYRVQYSPTGEATLSQGNQAPVADAGADQAGEQSYEMTLDGSASSDPDGDPMTYAWSIVSKPEGSMASLSDVKAVNPSFTPDLPGTYTIQLLVNDYFTDSTPSTITITATPLKSRVSVIPLSAGSGFISFNVNNIGRIGVSSGVIDISLTDPAGMAAGSGSGTFSLAVGQTATVNIPLSVPSLKFGNYTLTYTQSDETRTGSPTTVSISNAATVAFSFDKPTYRVRETANLTLNLTNTGKFNLENVSVTVSAPDAGYTYSQTVSLPPSPQPSPTGGEGTRTVQIPLPETMMAGQHSVNVTLTLPSGSATVQSAKFAVPESSLALGHAGFTTVTAGNITGLTIENTGGVDTTYSTEKLSVTDTKGTVIYEGSVTDTLLAGEKKTVTAVRMPDQTATGIVSFYVKVRNNTTGETPSLRLVLDVYGVEATLSARTDKDVYLKTEAVSALGTLANNAFNIENGTLNIKVNRYKKEDTAQAFSHFLPKTGWFPFNNPRGVAADSDGSVYVADTQNNRIAKFDSSGGFIAEWGSYGWGDGQFIYPQGVAVSSDGFVYVVDNGNNRIQKFDRNGNFISKWGSYGSGDGQFYNAEGIAVAPDGSVYVTESGNYRVQKFDSNGNFITKWGGGGWGDSGDGKFVYPAGVAVAPNGFVYVADYYRMRLQKFDSNGNFITKWGISGRADDRNGDGVPDYPYNGQFWFPYGVAVASDGSVYVADSGNSRIQKFDGSGNFISQWTRWGASDGAFNTPYGVAADSNGNVYVADTYNNRIQKFNSSGSFITKWGEQFLSPEDVAIASDGAIYVADTRNHRILKFGTDGSFVTEWGRLGSGNGQFYYPHGIAVGSDGSIYVVDATHRVQKFDGNGNFIATWGGYGSGDGQFNYPYRIAAAPDGFVYVADSGNKRIQKFDQNGNFVTKWGSYCNTDTNGDRMPDQPCNGQFYGPAGISMAPDGSVYVMDSGNHRIQKFDSSGVFITTWGSYGWGYGQFINPLGVAIDSDGFVYVADAYNNRIQKFDSDGNFISIWGSYGRNDGEFSYPQGIAVGPDNSVYVVDTYNNRIQKLHRTAGSGNLETLFETSLSLTQPADTAMEYSTNIGALNVSGKLYLEATLKNSLGQTLANAEYPFYIIDGNTVLLFSTDKKVYKPGEIVTISGEVRNLSAVEAVGLTLRVKGQGAGGQEETIYTETFNVPAEGSHAFTATTTAGAEGVVTLTGTVSQNNTTLVEIMDQYEVAIPKVTATVTAPEVVGNEAFGMNVELKNTGKVAANVECGVRSAEYENLQTITIPAGETRLLQYTQQITASTTYTFTFTGDLNQTVTKTVSYGLAATINIGSGGQGQGSSMYPEGKVAIPVTITNTGSLDEALQVSFQLSSQQSGVSSQAKTYYIPKGGNATDTLYFDLTEGTYQLSATSQQPNATASTSFSVLKENKVNMSTTAGSQGANGLIPVTMTLVNNGYNAINGSIALAVMNNDAKAVWRGEAAVAGLASQTSANYIINVDASGIVPGVYKADIILYSASGLQLAANQAQIRTEGPIFEITSMPNNPTFTVGRQGTFNFTVKNTGTLSGSASFKVAAMDILNQSVTDTFAVGQEKNYSFTFTVPEDTAEQDYPAEYTLTPTLSQGAKGNVAFHVAQVKVGMTAALDKEAYKNGETAVLTLSIIKQSATEDGTYIAIIRYGSYHDMQTFTLSSQPVTLTFNVPLTVITGGNLFYGVHFESGMTISRNSLFINEARPDLAAEFRNQNTEDRIQTMEVGKDNNVQIDMTVTNYGKTSSDATTVSLYDGDPSASSGQGLIETKPVRALNPGESDTITVFWNVLGKAGERILSAVVDPQDLVTEYSEENNMTYRNVLIPDLAIFTDTDKDTYKIRQKVYITSLITNLTATTPYNNLTLTTTAKDPSGSVVFSKNTAIGAISPSSSTTMSEIWSTTGLPVDGAYTITQTLTNSTGYTVQSTKSIVLEKAPDFTLATDVNSRKIKQGEEAIYTAALNPILGWNHETAMGIEGLPAGTTVTFNPDKLLPPGQSQTVVITTGATTIGSHTLYLTAQGTDEGEIVVHTVPLTLDVAGFGLETTPTQTIKQIETAPFPINLTSLNGYEGNVSLSISGMPYGTKATFDNLQLAAPGTATLTVLTSKYAKPGTYPLTITGNDGLVTHTLNLSLVLQPNPDIAVGIIATPGPGPQNDAVVKVFKGDLQLVKEFAAFTTKYGATAITADIDGDGYDEFIAAQGPDPKNSATLRVIRRDGTPFIEYTAFDAKYGLTLASADLDGDWKDEIIVGMGPDPKNAGTIKILKYNGTGFTEVMTRTVTDTMYGVNIATGDIDGDGMPEIITSPGSGPTNTAVIKVWRYTTTGLTEVSSFTAFEGGYGVNITAGDIDGDGTAEIITGTGPDPKNTAIVRVYRADGAMIKEFSPYDAGHAYGVTISAGDINNDGIAEIITGLGPGPQNEPLVKVFKADGSETGSFTAYPEGMDYGVKVSAGRTGN